MNKPVGLKITDQEIDNLWLQTGSEPTTHRIHTDGNTQRCKWPGAQRRCAWMAQSNTSVPEADSQKREGRHSDVSWLFCRLTDVSVPEESGLNETNIDIPGCRCRYPKITKAQSRYGTNDSAYRGSSHAYRPFQRQAATFMRVLLYS